jgi:hypothetical protein
MRVMKARDLDPASPLVCFCEVAARDPFFLVGKCERSGFYLADLPRLKVATVSEVPTPWLCLQHDLRERGVDPGRINRVTDRTMGDNLRALREGEVDVVQMFEPYVSMALRTGAGDILYAASNRGPTVYTTFLTTPDSIRRNRVAFAAMVRATRRTLNWIAEHSAEELAHGSCHSTQTCYQSSLRLRFDATETRACRHERRRCHVKGLIAWPKASSLVGLFPECIVTRTVSIKACARHHRRGDRATVRGIYRLAYLHAEIASSHRVPREIWTKRMSIFKLQHGMAGHKKWSCAAATCGSECPLCANSGHSAAFTLTARERSHRTPEVSSSRRELKRGDDQKPCANRPCQYRSRERCWPCFRDCWLCTSA